VATATRPLTQQERSAELNVLVRKQKSLWEDAGHRFVRNPAAMTGLVIVMLAGLLAIFAPLIAPYSPTDTSRTTLADPFWAGTQYVDQKYLLGTDQIGRDILSRLIWGSRISMIVGFVPVAVIFVIGVSVGLLSGYFGGWPDQLLMRLTDVIYAFPDLLFLIIIFATLRNHAIGELMGGLILMFVGIAIVNWVGMARLVRGQVLSLKEKEFVEAARAIGASAPHIMVKHLFPNALGPVIVAVAFGIPSAMLAEGILSFIGVGIRPPTATWGVMINEGYQVFSTSPWPVMMPAVCIAVVMLAFTFIGDGIRDAIDPRMKI
jgi:oligopeptide transport system permease protein